MPRKFNVKLRVRRESELARLSDWMMEFKIERLDDGKHIDERMTNIGKEKWRARLALPL